MQQNTVLAGRRVVVTGGLGQLGRQLGSALAARGAAVLLLDRAPQVPVDGVAAVIGGADLSDPSSVSGAFAQAAARLGGIDALVNVAGGFVWEKLEGGRLETWDRMYSTNLRTALLCSQAALPLLLAQPASCIVNIGALSANRAAAGMGAYAASKAGVARLTEAMAEEFKDRGLRVNAVLPSIIDTPANRADMPGADASRWVSPDALARVIAFLVSDDALAVTGACIPVSGRV